jgi:diguanylate cyclase (GGDEF)-like protein
MRGMSWLTESPSSSALVKRALSEGFGALLESAHTLAVLIDEQGQPVAANPAFGRLRQVLPSARYLAELVLPAHRLLLEQAIASAHSSRQVILEQIGFDVPNRVIHCSCAIVAAGRGATLILAEPTLPESDLVAANAQLADELGAARAALELKTAELHAVLAQADELAHTDSLTLLPNRRSIIADLQRQVTYAERYETPLAVSMLDLDGFKAINDQLGHSVGDRVLGFVARGLRDRIRQPDQIGRYGGDEFLVILPNSTSVAASEQASRLCQYVRSTSLSLVDGMAMRLTLSAGITHLKPGDDDWRTLLERADRALYEAKRQGGDRWLILES